MNKYFIFALVAVFSFVSLGLSLKTGAHKNDSARVPPTPTPPARIETVEIDGSEITVQCPPGMRPVNDAADDKVSSIKVKTSVVNPSNEEIFYNYAVSGGRIVGTGASVVWDLSGIRPGTFTITVGITVGENYSPATQTKIIQLKDTDCMDDIICPTLAASSPTDSVKAGETATFTAKVTSDPTYEIKYHWTVLQGEIVEGQGTSQIKVKTTREMAGSSLTAIVQTKYTNSVKINQICPITASETVSITK